MQLSTTNARAISPFILPVFLAFNYCIPKWITFTLQGTVLVDITALLTKKYTIKIRFFQKTYERKLISYLSAVSTKKALLIYTKVLGKSQDVILRQEDEARFHAATITTSFASEPQTFLIKATHFASSDKKKASSRGKRQMEREGFGPSKV